MKIHPKLKDKLWDIFSSGYPKDHDWDVLRKIFLINLITLCGVIFITLLGIIAIIQESLVLFILDFCALLLLLNVFFFLRKTKKYDIASKVGTIFTGIFFFLLFAIGGVDNTAYVWSYAYPIISLFLLGTFWGSITSLSYFFMILIIFYFGSEVSFFTIYNTNLIIRFIPSYLLVYIFSFFIENVRRTVQARLHQANIKLERTNKELTEANQLKEDLFHITAHDLRNPLHAIKSGTELLHYPDLSEEDKNELLSAIENSANNILILINNLLKSATIENSNFVLNFEKVDLAIEFKDTIKELNLRAKRKNQSINFESPVSLIAEVDIQRIKEVLENLINNSIKYSPLGSHISVNLSDDGDSVLIQVTDEGAGFTDDDKKLVFGKFRKLTAKPTAGESSTGLGLYIVKSLIDLHNGSVWLESEKGNGAAFFVRLPKSNSN